MKDDELKDFNDDGLENIDFKEENHTWKKVVVWIIVGLIVFWSIGRFYWWS